MRSAAKAPPRTDHACLTLIQTETSPQTRSFRHAWMSWLQKKNKNVGIVGLPDVKLFLFCGRNETKLGHLNLRSSQFCG